MRAGREPKKTPLEDHGRLKNVKITKIFFNWGVPYTFRKLKRRAFQQANEHTNRIRG